MTKQAKKILPVDNANTHITNMGPMIEELELTIRKFFFFCLIIAHGRITRFHLLGNQVEGIYIQKTREIMNAIRNPDKEKAKAMEAVTQQMAKNMAGKTR